MKKKPKISISPLLLIGVFLVSISSCKKDNNSPSSNSKIKVSYGTMTDQDGNTYNTVTIGTQTWMAENLRATTYNDGNAIPEITNGNEWSTLTTGAYCAYSTVHYGKLYNWYAVNTGKLAPKGWHIPTRDDWTQLINYLGGDSIAGGKLKETGTAHWYSPNTGATNEAGFTALPGGVFNGHDFYGFSEQGLWWSITDDNKYGPYTMNMSSFNNDASLGQAIKNLGISVRCICDKTIEGNGTPYPIDNNATVTHGTMNDQEGNVYKTVTIGTQTWMAENIRTIRYNDGSVIPNVTNDASWNSLTTGAYCNYNNTNNTDTIVAYGRLYNWYAVKTEKLAPKGWHVATDEDWNTLTITLGGEQIAGGKLKDIGTSYWQSPNTGATNEIGFKALPGGYRWDFGTFFSYSSIGTAGAWWSASENFGEFSWNDGAWCRGLTNTSPQIIRLTNNKESGYSVRCVKD